MQDEAMLTLRDLNSCPLVEGDIQTEILTKSDKVNYSFIQIPKGGFLVLHDSIADIAMYVISGAAILQYGEETTRIFQGSFVHIRRHTMHRLDAEENTAILHLLTH